jgi:hypothetical protein
MVAPTGNDEEIEPSFIAIEATASSCFDDVGAEDEGRELEA